MSVVMVGSSALRPAGAGEHPRRHANYNHARGHLEIGLGGFNVKLSRIMQTDESQHPNDGRV
ncbi:hypothetical protein SDC9_191685 [bioreactor metagenome]|uniref:Uncharacterized protein n=1 Tax=bioreactor metagenome TaxID=1076179 RepID=A0A645I6U5_9ZZZZ